MKHTGIVRRLDMLGRVVVPVETRRVLGIQPDDALEFMTDGQSVVMHKFEVACLFCGRADDLTCFRDRKVCRSCWEALTGGRRRGR